MNPVYIKMDWPNLEGVPRVMACYKEWKHYKRLRKHASDKKLRKFLKQEIRNEFDELVDAILCLGSKECAELRNTVHSDCLYHLLMCYGHSQYIAREP